MSSPKYKYRIVTTANPIKPFRKNKPETPAQAARRKARKAELDQKRWGYIF